MLGRKQKQPDMDAADIIGKSVYVYCAHCGGVSNTAYVEGEFVLVSQPGERPYFGIFKKMSKDDNDIIATINRGGTENDKVPIRYIEKAPRVGSTYL